MGLDVREIFHASEQRQLHQPVLDDVAKLGQAEVGGIEAGGEAVQLPGFQPAIGAQPHLLQVLPGAGLLQQLHRSLTDGGDPQIQRLLRRVLLRQLGFDDPHREALGRQQTGGSRPHHAGADDGNITLFHNFIPAKGAPRSWVAGAKPNGAMIPQGGGINSEGGGELLRQIKGKTDFLPHAAPPLAKGPDWIFARQSHDCGVKCPVL